MRKGKFKCLLDYLEDNPFESIIDMEEEDIKIECLVANFDQKVIYLEFDSRLRKAIAMYGVKARLDDDLWILMKNCDYFCRCATVW